MTTLQQVVVGVAGLLAISYVVSGSDSNSNGNSNGGGGGGGGGFAPGDGANVPSAQELAQAVDKLDNENRMLRNMIGEVQKEQKKQLQLQNAAAAAAAAAPARPKRGPPSREIVAQRHAQQRQPPPPPPPLQVSALDVDPYAADNKVGHPPADPEAPARDRSVGRKPSPKRALKLGEYPGPQNVSRRAPPFPPSCVPSAAFY